jgi:hypothetical protein
LSDNETTTGGVSFPGLFDAWGKQIIAANGRLACSDGFRFCAADWISCRQQYSTVDDLPTKPSVVDLPHNHRTIDDDILSTAFSRPKTKLLASFATAFDLR